jgi:hypothetical protein
MITFTLRQATLSRAGAAQGSALPDIAETTCFYYGPNSRTIVPSESRYVEDARFPRSSRPYTIDILDTNEVSVARPNLAASA